MTVAAVDLTPALRLLLLAGGLAALPLAWLAWRQRGVAMSGRLAALTGLTLVLTFDLIVFGAFTRLTDSGLGCPDWPGCYGELTPLAAHSEITQAQAAQPTGPVTHTKAWIEMIHRYLAMVVGALILVLAVRSTWARRELPHTLFWPWVTLAWVIVQGLFGKYTVTLKLYPAVVTAHLLGAMVLLALLVLQREAYRPVSLPLPAALRRLAGLALGLVVAQVALGGWVSTNYAVLACQGFPTCNGQWWPEAMDARQGYTVLRELGRSGDGSFLPAPALVAIHWGHRLIALAVTAVLVALGLGLARLGRPDTRRWAWALGLALAWQTTSGLGNVVLQWPLAGALAHSAGAAVLVGLLTALNRRAWRGRAVTEPISRSLSNRTESMPA